MALQVHRDEHGEVEPHHLARDLRANTARAAFSAVPTTWRNCPAAGIGRRLAKVLDLAEAQGTTPHAASLRPARQIVGEA